MPENGDAFKIYFMVRYQLIMSFGGVVDINHMAVDAAIKREGIKNQKACFNKVLKICREYWIPKLNEKKDEK